MRRVVDSYVTNQIAIGPKQNLPSSRGGSCRFWRDRLKSIPLLSATGRVLAFTYVDDDDYEALSARAWHHDVRGSGYAAYRKDGRVFLMHRVLMGLDYGDKLEVDHINGDGLDNRRENLRVVTHGQNMQNKRSARGVSSSFRGVYWKTDKQRWVAQARVDGRQHFLGYYESEETAARVAKEWREKNMPFAVAGR